MKRLLLLYFLTPFALAAEPLQSMAALPSVLQPIRHITPPPTQSTLLEDTELEMDLRVSLEENKPLKSLAAVQSVNCVEKRCQILVENLSEANRLKDAFQAHLDQHPEFGKSVLVSPNMDKDNKKLLTFVFSPKDQISSTR